IYDYIAQTIVRGQMPYRDVIDPKTPLSSYISAAAMMLGRSVGIRDVIAVRWLHVFLMGFLAAATVLVADAYFQNRIAAILACAMLMLIDVFPSLVIRGTQPKLSMILFGMLSLLLIARGKHFAAGLAAMLSFLCWQPGLMFAGAVFLVATK